MRRAALAAAFALASGAAVAGPLAWPPEAHDGVPDIGFAPWSELAEATALPAEDAFVFGDVVRTGGIDAATAAIAVRIDQRRMTEDPDGSEPDDHDRVAGAFARFAPVGEHGLAYAALGVARGDAAIRTARAPVATPSLLAMIGGFGR